MNIGASVPRCPPPRRPRRDDVHVHVVNDTGRQLVSTFVYRLSCLQFQLPHGHSKQPTPYPQQKTRFHHAGRPSCVPSPGYHSSYVCGFRGSIGCFDFSCSALPVGQHQCTCPSRTSQDLRGGIDSGRAGGGRGGLSHGGNRSWLVDLDIGLLGLAMPVSQGPRYGKAEQHDVLVG